MIPAKDRAAISTFDPLLSATFLRAIHERPKGSTFSATAFVLSAKLCTIPRAIYIDITGRDCCRRGRGILYQEAIVDLHRFLSPPLGALVAPAMSLRA